MNKKVLKTLEYDKIIARLAGHASSEAGRGMCLSLLPETDTEKIVLNQRKTTDACARLSKRPGPHFSGLKDVKLSLARMKVGGVLTCRDLLEISGVLDAAGSALKFLEPEQEEKRDSLSEFHERLDSCPELNTEIKRCVLAYDEVADDASPALKEIRRKKIFTSNQVQKTLTNIISSSSMQTYLQDALVTMRDGRYCIPVKAEHKAHVPGMIHDQSGSGATVFIEPMSVVKLNNEIKELSLEEEAEILKILERLTLSASVCAASIETDEDLLAELDFILAKAGFSKELSGAEPKIERDGFLELINARHPLLDKESAVPVSVTLGGDYSMLIVTGPNTGGKTVSLKTTGLLCLMGQAGLHIPADEGSCVCVFNEIYADIGDEQSIEQSLSTFSSHMKNIVDILEKADSDSLVLLDELCSGTDPSEGAALAQAILTRLYNYGAKTMITTHYPELKVFAITKEGAQNACCEFDLETLRPTYRLITGLPGKSNAFAISKKLGLDERIIDEAAGLLDAEDVAFEDVLADIEADRKSAELDREKAAEELSQAEKIRENFEKERAAFLKEKDGILSGARAEAYELLSRAKGFADATIKEIRKSSKNVNLSALERARTEAGKRAKDALSALSKENEKTGSNEGVPATGENIYIGADVHIISMNMDAKVTSLSDSSGKAGVSLGGMNMKIALKDLLLLPEKEERQEKTKKEKTAIGHMGFEKSLGVSGEIKLLGLTTDEALLELSKYLDDAQMAHLESVRIVHGKGTGALRNAVQQYLRHDSRIKAFKLAEYGEGDSGVTVAQFK